jgi:hypothetical protein
VRPAGIGSIVIRRANIVPPTASPAVSVLAVVLLLLASLMLTDLHLLAAARLGKLIGPSPLPGLTRLQIGKLAALAGIAMLCGGAVLMALQWPKGPDDRQLAKSCLVLLGSGGLLATTFDLAPAVWPGLVEREVAGLVELAIQHLVLGGCTVLVASRLARAGAVRCCEPGGDAAPAMAWPGAKLQRDAGHEGLAHDARPLPPRAIDAGRRDRIDRHLAFVDHLAATHGIAAVPGIKAHDRRRDRTHLEVALTVSGRRPSLSLNAGQPRRAVDCRLVELDGLVIECGNS